MLASVGSRIYLSAWQTERMDLTDLTANRASNIGGLISFLFYFSIFLFRFYFEEPNASNSDHQFNTANTSLP